MAEIVREAMEPHLALGVKSALAKAARYLGISLRRAEAYHWGEVRAVLAWEADAMRESREALREQRIARLEHELAVLQALQKDSHAGSSLDIRDDGRPDDASGLESGGARPLVLPGCKVGA